MKPAFWKKGVLEYIDSLMGAQYELRNIPGKGRGLLANGTIHTGDQIFAFTPVVLFDADTYKLPDFERLAMSKFAIEKLPAIVPGTGGSSPRRPE